MDEKQPQQQIASQSFRRRLSAVPQVHLHQTSPPDRLKQMIEPLKKGEQYRPEDSIFLKLNNRYQLIQVQTITMISSAGHYTMLTTSDGKKGLVSKSMGAWESDLPKDFFMRIHRTTIINLTHIIRIERSVRNLHQVYLEYLPEPLSISDRYLAAVKRSIR